MGGPPVHPWLGPSMCHSFLLSSNVHIHLGHLHNRIKKDWTFWVSASLTGAFHQSGTQKIGNSHSVALCHQVSASFGHSLHSSGSWIISAEFIGVNCETISMIPTPQPWLDMESPVLLFFSLWWEHLTWIYFHHKFYVYNTVLLTMGDAAQKNSRTYSPCIRCKCFEGRYCYNGLNNM